MLVAIREEDLRTRSKPWTPKYAPITTEINNILNSFNFRTIDINQVQNQFKIL